MTHHSLATREPTALATHCSDARHLWGAAVGVGAAVLECSGPPRLREAKGWQACTHTRRGVQSTHTHGSSWRPSCSRSQHHSSHRPNTDACCMAVAGEACLNGGMGAGLCGWCMWVVGWGGAHPHAITKHGISRPSRRQMRPAKSWLVALEERNTLRCSKFQNRHFPSFVSSLPSLHAPPPPHHPPWRPWKGAGPGKEESRNADLGTHTPHVGPQVCDNRWKAWH